ncbi:hypothetical protein B0O99DRAFT_680193 [Bisporella sp. PMI_857]|nr:hypothetical protein B0O99DRAFT_680193 [Bisporella sp. PMI_857]
MAVSQAASVVEKIIGHGSAITEQDIANPGRDRAKYADRVRRLLLLQEEAEQPVREYQREHHGKKACTAAARPACLVPDAVPDEKALYPSDVLATSWNCVVDTGVEKGGVVVIWGAGKSAPLKDGEEDEAKRFDRPYRTNLEARLCLVQVSQSRETLDFSSLLRGTSVASRLKEMVDGRGPDVALECVAGEYPKGWARYFELMLGFETDSSEIVDETIMSVRNFGRCGITGVYVGFTNHFNIRALMERGIRLVGNGQAPVHMYWEELLKMIESGEIGPLKMDSHRVDISELKEAYYKFEKKEDGMQKVFVADKILCSASCWKTSVDEKYLG